MCIWKPKDWELQLENYISTLALDEKEAISRFHTRGLAKVLSRKKYGRNQDHANQRREQDYLCKHNMHPQIKSLE